MGYEKVARPLLPVAGWVVGNTEKTVTVGGTRVAIDAVVHEDGGDLTHAELGLHRHSATAGAGATLEVARSRGSESNETIVSSGDALMRIVASGFDGVDYEQAAAIRVEVDGTPGAGDMPGRIMFLVSADGSATPVEALRISANKSIGLSGRIDLANFATFTNADTTPSLVTGNLFKASNSGATSITGFDDGVNGQWITVVFTNGNTTIVDGANLHLAGGTNFVGSADDTLTLVFDGSSWFEKARSVN